MLQQRTARLPGTTRAGGRAVVRRARFEMNDAGTAVALVAACCRAVSDALLLLAWRRRPNRLC
eukprot:7442980-Lingulodinium_polyedra.AAC.1